MKDIKIGNVRPIAEPRAPEKSGRKEPVSGQSFSQTLERAVTQMNEVTRQSATPAAGADATAIQAEYSAAKQQFDTLMRVEQQLRQLHQNITRKPTQDKG
jgi:flagellar hook-basal body complex protein FliE